MRALDEQRLFEELASWKPLKTTRDIVRELDISEKRAAYILSKWERRGWWEYGCNILAGWFTDAGHSANLASEETDRP